MPRIFIPIESVTIAHVVRPLQVAKALRSRGVEVIFGSSDRYRCWIEEEGFEVRPLFCEDPAILLDAVRTLDFSKQVAALPAYFHSDLAGIRGALPVDAVLGDFRFTVRLAAEYLGVPHIALTNGYYSPYYDVLPELPEVIAGDWPQGVRQNRLLRKLVRMTVPRFHARPYQKLCRKYFLKSQIRTGFDIAVSKTLTLLCDLPEFTPQRKLPAYYQFVGPIQWEPVHDGQPVPEEFDGQRRPLIYVTSGTSGNVQTLDALIDFFEDKPYDVVISTGSKDYVRLSDNIYAVPFVKASTALQRASLMICHGGNGSIYQALAHAVPVLCVTTFYDQEWNGQRVRDLGIGESIFHSRLKQTALKKLIDSLICDESIRSRLAFFRSRMEEWSGAETAADKIMDHLKVTARTE